MARVLVVEDDRDIAELLTVMLTIDGNDVRAAYGGEAAVAMVDEFSPQAIITDLNMNRTDGLELCLALRGRSRFSQIPILIYTAAHYDDARLIEARGLAHVEVAAKPLLATALNARIRTMLAPK